MNIAWLAKSVKGFLARVQINFQRGADGRKRRAAAPLKRPFLLYKGSGKAAFSIEKKGAFSLSFLG
jgi:hypothetical protein